MPIDMVIVATIRSIIKNGKAIRKPISKPRRNSEIINAGTKVLRSLISPAPLSPNFSSASFLNIIKSFSRTCAAINSRKGSTILPNATSCVILLSRSGCRPSFQALSKVGAMTKNVKNRARLVTTILAGVLCIPIADLKNERATMIRVKLVTITRMLGAKDKTVSTRKY